MKKLLCAGLLIITSLITGTAHAQSFLDKMKKFAGDEDTIGVMKSSDSYVIAGNGSVTMPDGSVQEGTVVLNVTPDKKDLTYIFFTPASEMKPKKLWSDDIQSCTIKGKVFMPIRTKEDDISIGHKTIFMEMLNDSPNDKFKMFRFRKLEENKMKGAGQKPYDLKRGFYVMLPDFKNAHEIVDMTFTPFAKKMSEYLKDCPDLAKKIEDKEKGYKVNMFNGAANDEVFMRVMQEYNHCGK